MNEYAAGVFVCMHVCIGGAGGGVTSERVCICVAMGVSPCSVYQCIPGCVDPDDVQVAEVVALRVQLVAAGAALGPHSVCWDKITGLCFRLLHQWKTQT